MKNRRPRGAGASLGIRCVALCLVTVGAACGDGPKPKLKSLTPEQRFDAGELVAARHAAQPKTDLPRETAELKAYIESLPEFAEAGVSGDHTVWGRFVDGKYFVAVVPKAGPAGFAEQQQQSSALTVPDRKNAFLFDHEGLAPQAMAFLPTQLSRFGYSPTTGDGRLASLRNVEGAAAVYLSAHGGSINDGGRSSTSSPPANAPTAPARPTGPTTATREASRISRRTGWSRAASGRTPRCTTSSPPASSGPTGQGSSPGTRSSSWTPAAAATPTRRRRTCAPPSPPEARASPCSPGAG
ncbi:MAG: hypothetical protein QM765_30690 [Myxococcales bacterium]